MRRGPRNSASVPVPIPARFPAPIPGMGSAPCPRCARGMFPVESCAAAPHALLLMVAVPSTRRRVERAARFLGRLLAEIGDERERNALATDAAALLGRLERAAVGAA